MDDDEPASVPMMIGAAVATLIICWGVWRWIFG